MSITTITTAQRAKRERQVAQAIHSGEMEGLHTSEATKLMDVAQGSADPALQPALQQAFEAALSEVRLQAQRADRDEVAFDPVEVGLGTGADEVLQNPRRRFRDMGREVR